MPLKVWVPDPVLVYPPSPCITPDKVTLLEFPAVRTCELAISTVPAPDNDPTVSVASTS